MESIEKKFPFIEGKKLNSPIEEFVKPLELVLKPEQMVSDVLAFVQIGSLQEEIPYFYVTDNQGRLIGVVPAKKILFSPAFESIESIMETSVIMLDKKDKMERALEKFLESKLLSIPVVDSKKILIGAMYISAILGESVEILDKERKDDLFQLVGLHLEVGKRRSVFKGYLERMPWIFCNLFGGFACAMISDYFELVLSKFLVLAMFLPLVLSLSESVSMQSVLQTLLLIRNSPGKGKMFCKTLFKEMRVVGLIAFTCALVVGFMTPFWGESSRTCSVMACGIFISIIISATIGSLLSISLHKSSLDPKIASGPISLMIADVGTTMIYLSLATYWLL